MSFQFEHLEQAPASGKADRAVILLHGYGSNKERAFEQAPWLAAAFPGAHIFAADGTFPYSALMDPKSPGMSDEAVPGLAHRLYQSPPRRPGRHPHRRGPEEAEPGHPVLDHLQVQFVLLQDL